jgi:hypothetical protein
MKTSAPKKKRYKSSYQISSGAKRLFTHWSCKNRYALNFWDRDRVCRKKQIYGLMIQIPVRKRRSMSILLWKMFAGSGLIGAQDCFYASDYFDKLYEFAEALILKGKAFVCELSSEEMRQYRGNSYRTGERKSIPRKRN